MGKVICMHCRHELSGPCSCQKQEPRFFKKVSGGTVVEDDGGFVNFMPDPPSSLGSIIDLSDEEDEEPLKDFKLV